MIAKLTAGRTKQLFRAVASPRQMASIEKTEQHLAGGLDVVTDAFAHRRAIAGDEAFQHEIMLCIGRMVIARIVQQVEIRADLQPEILDDRIERFRSGGTVDREMKLAIA